MKNIHGNIPLENLFDGREYVSKNNLPSSFKVTRVSALQLSRMEKDLFSEIEAQEQGVFYISEIPQHVTAYDLTALNLAMAQILYNQSYLSGNLDTNSGYKREETRTEEYKWKEPTFQGNIIVTLNDLCRAAYGVDKPDSKTRKRMRELIEAVEGKKVCIRRPDGQELKSNLFSVMNCLSKKNGSVCYYICLNPIYCYSIKNQFGELPQDIIKTLSKAVKKKTAQHLLLLRWLCAQDKREAHKVYIGTIAQELRLEGQFKKNRARAEENILSVCDTMVEIGMLLTYDIEYKTNTGARRVGAITFHLNPSFIRNTAHGQGTPQERPGILKEMITKLEQEEAPLLFPETDNPN